mgnify:CR=1 FL=1
MSDYIKREDAVRAVVDAKTGKDKTIDGTRQVTDCLRRIKAIPSADVVEVVRCKDCKYYEPDGVCANINFLSVRPNDYCSYAEKI